MTEDILENGIHAARSGDLPLARTLLANAVRQNPASARAWLWLGRVMDDPDKKKFCFQKARQLDPGVLEAEKSRPIPPAAARPVGTVAPPFPGDASPRALPKSSVAVEAGQVVVVQPTLVAETPVKAEVESPASMEPAGEEPERRQISGEKARSKSPPLLGLLLGLFAGCLLIGVPAVLVVLSGRLDGLLFPEKLAQPLPAAQALTAENTVTPRQTLPPTYTPTVSPSATLTLTPDAQRKLQSVEREFNMASTKMNQKLYQEAIPLWDKVITKVPDLSEAYFQRGLAYLMMLNNLRLQSEYEDYLKLALADMDQAISIGPTRADFFYRRGQVYWNMAAVAPYRADRQPMYEAALENIRVGVAMGTRVDWAERNIPHLLVLLGQCEQAQVELNRLFEAQPRFDPPSAGLNYLMSMSYLCLGQHEKALSHINVAIDRYDDQEYIRYKTEILHGLGRLDEANKLITENIDRSPSFGGYRYYVRALIEYDLGQVDKAREDLDLGAGNTWYHEGLYAYLVGRLALDDGDRDGAIAMFQYAEATIGRDVSPKILDRIRNELAALGEQPLSPTQSIVLHTTPFPPRVMGNIFQTATVVASTPTPTITPFVEVSYDLFPEGYQDAIQVIYSDGTGPLTLKPGDDLLFHFDPGGNIEDSLRKPVEITFYLDPPAGQVPASGELPLQVSLFTTLLQWQSIMPRWGENIIQSTDFFTSFRGDLYVSIRNLSSDMTIDVENAGFVIKVKLSNGKFETFRLKGK